MKTQFIKLEDCSIIVSDEDIKKDDLCYDSEHVNIYQALCDDFIKGGRDKKIIASTNPEHNLPSIDYNGLEEKLGIIDVEKLAEDYSGSFYHQDSFKEGFNKAQELNDKKFSLEEMIEAIEYAHNSGRRLELNAVENNFSLADYKQKLIQSLQQPTPIEIEVEMGQGTEYIHTYPDSHIVPNGSCKLIPRITNNKIKITGLK